MVPKQAEEGSPIKPSQAGRDERGRVNLDDLTDTDLDYGCDERGLAALRRRLKRAINSYDGMQLSILTAKLQFTGDLCSMSLGFTASVSPNSDCSCNICLPVGT